MNKIINVILILILLSVIYKFSSVENFEDTTETTDTPLPKATPKVKTPASTEPLTMKKPISRYNPNETTPTPNPNETTPTPNPNETAPTEPGTPGAVKTREVVTKQLQEKSYTITLTIDDINNLSLANLCQKISSN